MKLPVSLLLILAALALVGGKSPKHADDAKIRVKTVVNWICQLLKKLDIRNTKSICKNGKGRNLNQNQWGGGTMSINAQEPDNAFWNNVHHTEAPERPSGSLFHSRKPPVRNHQRVVTLGTSWYRHPHRSALPSASQQLSGETKEALDNLEWAFRGEERDGCDKLQEYVTEPRLKLAVRVAINMYLTRHCHAQPQQPDTPVPLPEPVKPVPVSVPVPETTSAPEKKPEDSDDHSGVCGVSPQLRRKTKASRIVGGNETGSCEVIPWQVRIKSSMGMCGGSIISHSHILTAAHCVHELQDASSITVVTGDYDKGKEEDTEIFHKVKTMTYHPQFDISDYKNDIAILTLYEPLDFSRPCVRKVCRDPSFVPSNMLCTVSGWGTTSSGGRVSETLQMVQVLTFRGNECRDQFSIPKNYPKYLSDKENQLCAGKMSGGKDSCQGDSGGPLVCIHPDTKTFVQVGVVSYGIGCATKGFPGVYSSVASFNHWVEATMAQNP